MTRSPLWALIAAATCAPGCSSPQTPDTDTALSESAPFVHVVLFKTRSESPDSAAAALMDDIREKLAPLPTVRGLWIGRPAPTNVRPIVDANYDVGLLILFDDQEGLQEYLDHPVHVKFAEKHDTTCDVRVFDFTKDPLGRLEPAP